MYAPKYAPSAKPYLAVAGQAAGLHAAGGLLQCDLLVVPVDSLCDIHLLHMRDSK